MTTKIFISYRRDDAAAYSRLLHERLKREFEHVFMDVVAIPLGVNFAKVLEERVAECDVFLAVIGRGWLDAGDEHGSRRLDSVHDFVRIEIAAALKRGIRIIPILLDGVRVPTAEQLPDDLKKLALFNALEVRHASFDSDAAKLISELQGPSTSRLEKTVGRAQPNLKYAAREVSEEVVQLGASHLRCVGGAIELWHGDDLVRSASISANVTRTYDPNVYEFDKIEQNQIDRLASEWPPRIAEHLKARLGQGGSEHSQCKIGLERFDYSTRGVSGAVKLGIRPLTYWVTRQFNKEIAVQADEYHARLRHDNLKSMLRTAEDFRIDFPSALYLEIGVITADGWVPVMQKKARQSALGVRAGGPIKTCGPEFGFVWASHVEGSGKSSQLLVEKALHEALLDELGVSADAVQAWTVNSLALQHAHLNSALVGTVKLKLSKVELKKALREPKYHEPVQEFIEQGAINSTLQSEHNSGSWHATGLLRLSLCSEQLSVNSGRRWRWPFRLSS